MLSSSTADIHRKFVESHSPNISAHIIDDYIPVRVTQEKKPLALSKEDDIDLTKSIFFPVDVPFLPIKHRPDNVFIRKKRTDGNSSFHEVQTATRFASDKNYFLKVIKEYSPVMAELEAFSAECYKFLIPSLVPGSTRALYDHTNKSKLSYIGVASKKLENFKSIKDSPLTRDDIEVGAMQRGVTLEQMLELNEKVKQSQLNGDLKQVIDSISVPSKHNKATYNIVDVTAKDIKNFRILLGLGKGLTANWINENDDVHRDNISKEGLCIDFDMCWWSIIWEFKQGKYYFDGKLREPGKGSFDFTPEDILRFPILLHAKPYYWPTRTPGGIPFANYFTLSKNPWYPDEIKIFSELSNNPVFNFAKFSIFLKFILADADIYEHLAEMHIRQELRKENSSLNVIQMLKEHIRQRINSAREVLQQLPEFHEFMDSHGEAAYASIKKEFEQQNNTYKEKINKIDKFLQELEANPSLFIIKYAHKFQLPDVHNSQETAMLKQRLEQQLIYKKNIYQKQIIDMNVIKKRFDQQLKNSQEVRKTHSTISEIKEALGTSCTKLPGLSLHLSA